MDTVTLALLYPSRLLILAMKYKLNDRRFHRVMTTTLKGSLNWQNWVIDLKTALCAVDGNLVDCLEGRNIPACNDIHHASEGSIRTRLAKKLHITEDQVSEKQISDARRDIWAKNDEYRDWNHAQMKLLDYIVSTLEQDITLKVLARVLSFGNGTKAFKYLKKIYHPTKKDSLMAALERFDTFTFQPHEDPEAFLRKWILALNEYEACMSLRLNPVDACARFTRAASQNNPTGQAWYKTTSEIDFTSPAAFNQLQSSFVAYFNRGKRLQENRRHYGG